MDRQDHKVQREQLELRANLARAVLLVSRDRVLRAHQVMALQ